MVGYGRGEEWELCGTISLEGLVCFAGSSHIHSYCTLRDTDADAIHTRTLRIQCVDLRWWQQQQKGSRQDDGRPATSLSIVSKVFR